MGAASTAYDLLTKTFRLQFRCTMHFYETAVAFFFHSCVEEVCMQKCDTHRTTTNHRNVTTVAAGSVVRKFMCCGIYKVLLRSFWILQFSCFTNLLVIDCMSRCTFFTERIMSFDYLKTKRLLLVLKKCKHCVWTNEFKCGKRFSKYRSFIIVLVYCMALIHLLRMIDDIFKANCEWKLYYKMRS